MTLPDPAPCIPLAYQTSQFNPRDLRQLGLLVVLQYKWGALGLIVSTLLIIDIVMGIWIVRGSLGNPGTPPPNPFVGWVIIISCSICMLLGYTVSALNIYCARCVQQRRRRTFGLVMAGVNCIAFPLGTALGIFAFVVLLRDSVGLMYGGGKAIIAESIPPSTNS